MCRVSIRAPFNGAYPLSERTAHSAGMYVTANANETFAQSVRFAHAAVRRGKTVRSLGDTFPRVFCPFAWCIRTLITIRGRFVASHDNRRHFSVPLPRVRFRHTDRTYLSRCLSFPLSQHFLTANVSPTLSPVIEPGGRNNSR